MVVILDIMIGLGAILAAAYCMVLSYRLRALTRLDGDVGKAIAVLSGQVDMLTRVLRDAETSSVKADTALQDQITRAEATARRLELLMAAGQAGTNAAPSGFVSAVAPRFDEDRSSDEAGFAPFDRAVSRAHPEPRGRILRHRDAAGALK